MKHHDNMTRRSLIGEALDGKRHYHETPFAIDVKGGENVERWTVLPSISVQEIV